MESDHVDQLLAQWARQRPDLDCSPMGVLGRVARMAAIAGFRYERGSNSVGFSASAVLSSRPAAARLVSRLSGGAMLLIGAGLLIDRFLH